MPRPANGIVAREGQTGPFYPNRALDLARHGAEGMKDGTGVAVEDLDSCADAGDSNLVEQALITVSIHARADRIQTSEGLYRKCRPTMFNNLVNAHDMANAFRKPGELLRLLRQVPRGNRGRVEDAWSETEHALKHWWDIPEVVARWNGMITGDSGVSYHEYITAKYLKGRENLRALSIGCGTGKRVLIWVGLGDYSLVDAIDISKARIEKAIAAAREEGYGNIIRYQAANIFDVDLPESSYDVVFAEQALHHLSPLKELLLRIDRWLSPGGLFVLNEFVGPTRFQWTDRQLEAVNALLSLIPDRYKKLPDGKGTKRGAFRPSRLHMMLNDPSEAVESSNIIPYLNEIFEILEFREYGGTVLHPLFANIAHNFIGDEPEAKRWLRVLFEVEDLLLAGEGLASDFAVAICGKRP